MCCVLIDKSQERILLNRPNNQDKKNYYDYMKNSKKLSLLSVYSNGINGPLA